MAVHMDVAGHDSVAELESRTRAIAGLSPISEWSASSIAPRQIVGIVVGTYLNAFGNFMGHLISLQNDFGTASILRFDLSNDSCNTCAPSGFTR